jgi:heme/copper-type cytochrome/quinol oxidase subunit 1
MHKKTALIFLFTGILLLTLLYLKSGIFFTKKTVDIHLHDTYYVIAYLHFIILIVLFVGTAFSIGGVFGTRFRNKYFLIPAAVFLFADVVLILQIVPYF